MVVSYGIDPNNKCASLENFRSTKPKQTAPIQAKPAEAVVEADKVEVSKPAEKAPEQINDADPKKKKTSLVQRFKNFVAGVKKFFIASWEYTKGTAKGIFYGATAALGILGVDGVINAVKNAKADKLVETATDVAPKAIEKAKRFSTKGKVFAGIAAVATLGYQLFKSSLNVSEKKAAVDHRWGSGHNKES